MQPTCLCVMCGPLKAYSSLGVVCIPVYMYVYVLCVYVYLGSSIPNKSFAFNHPGHGESRNRTLSIWKKKKKQIFSLCLILTLNKVLKEKVEQIQPFKYLLAILGAEGTKANNSQRVHILRKGHLYNR